MDDPYTVLGVRRDDSEKTIRAAYRKLAKRHHPDLNPGKPEAAETFKAINAANDILSDPEKRARFDRGEIDAAGNETPPPRPFYRDTPDTAGRYGGGPELSPEDLEGLFGGAFGEHFDLGGFGARARPAHARGGDMHYSLTVDFLDAARGAVRRLTLPDGRTLDVTIPAGLRDGHVLRLKGQGRPGRGDGPAGDALVEIGVAPHKFFRRVGDDVVMDLPVTLQEAVLGATLEVPTLRGKVRLTIPPASRTGTRLRLAGRGIAGGNQVVELKVELPTAPEPELAAFLKTWQPQHPVNPRADLESE
jgi:DnaJ-class molecular chaperone